MWTAVAALETSDSWLESYFQTTCFHTPGVCERSLSSATAIARWSVNLTPSGPVLPKRWRGPRYRSMDRFIKMPGLSLSSLQAKCSSCIGSKEVEALSHFQRNQCRCSFGIETEFDRRRYALVANMWIVCGSNGCECWCVCSGNLDL